MLFGSLFVKCQFYSVGFRGFWDDFDDSFTWKDRNASVVIWEC